MSSSCRPSPPAGPPPSAWSSWPEPGCWAPAGTDPTGPPDGGVRDPGSGRRAPPVVPRRGRPRRRRGCASGSGQPDDRSPGPTGPGVASSVRWPSAAGGPVDRGRDVPAPRRSRPAGWCSVWRAGALVAAEPAQSVIVFGPTQSVQDVGLGRAGHPRVAGTGGGVQRQDRPDRPHRRPPADPGRGPVLRPLRVDRPPVGDVVAAARLGPGPGPAGRRPGSPRRPGPRSGP